MNWNERQKEIKSILETHGYEFKGTEPSPIPDSPHSNLLFEKEVKGNRVEVRVNTSKSSYSAEVKNMGSATNARNYENLKRSLTRALPAFIEALLKRAESGNAD